MYSEIFIHISHKTSQKIDLFCKAPILFFNFSFIKKKDSKYPKHKKRERVERVGGE